MELGLSAAQHLTQTRAVRKVTSHESQNADLSLEALAKKEIAGFESRRRAAL
jgi:hypothetical protein